MTITEIRHTLHDNPGVSGNEGFAHNLIVNELRALAPDELNEFVGGYGVVALWRSQAGDAKTLAFRADTDALPSGHRCGHDGHTAIMLRFAQLVSGNKRRRYNIVLIFQPEEETGNGAAKIVASGLLRKYGVNAVFGLHNLPGYPEGTVALNRGTFAAASSGVIYRLKGRATHASTPEKGLNPGRAAAAIVSRMDSLNRDADDIRHFRQSTLIGSRVGVAEPDGGIAYSFGTSAGCGEVMFTLRAYTNDAMQGLMSAADAIAAAEAANGHLELEKELREPFRATENTATLVDSLNAIFAPHLDVRFLERPFRWSEDFAEYLRVLPGAFFGLGSGIGQPELHHPDYNFPDSIIETGAKCFELIMNNIEI